MTVHYLSLTDIAKRRGVQRTSMSRYTLPEPDATVGSTRGWLPETVDEWEKSLPGKGARTDLKYRDQHQRTDT